MDKDLEDMHMALRKMIWLNTNLTWFIVLISLITMLSVWIESTIFQMLAFLLVSLFGMIFWYKADKKVKTTI